MRYLSIFKHEERDTPPTEEEMAAMGKLMDEMISIGALLATEGCLPSSKGARVRRAGETITITDGPFVESKEVVGGFALLEARSKEEAIELTKRFLDVAGDGEVEIRELYPQPALAQK